MSWMLNIRGGLLNTTNLIFAGEEWVTFDATTNLPQLHKKLRSHDAVTKGVPYMYSATAAYPGGLTQACATNPRAFLAVAAETLAAAAYGDFVIAGYFDDAAASGTIAAGANVEVINSGVAFIDDGTTTTNTSATAGRALGAAASSKVDVWLYESPVEIKAT
jgi:hypothetical protein